ncbi:Rdx family protein [Sinomicrobium soli]|uniref:SelT/SelW/SelH family protein n=1 Tax=Sinomicrobium sp. N-1-3-6 TaxID=2219864 RepID=UPI000DCB9264|nr:SelT/SelW/SelH family protein [Sinomicrobium sp. N-1-3-6]RAV30442.1 SelT/selW/selH selenoprotein [Sinomicrobium sp. N-1-3-6]
MNKAYVTIEYCPKCKWLLRAAYMAQEFLSTFEDDLGGVTLKPAETAGMYRIYVNDEVLFDRKQYGGFAGIRELKQRLRDRILPGKDLGHTDRSG